MSFDYAIETSGLGKCFEIYDKPSDRLKQMIFGAHRRFCREFWALKDVSIKVRKGDTVGIVGRNGSGKSTLLQLICGTLNPTVGEIKVNGRIAALLELGTGFNPEFTGIENIYMASSLYGLSREEVDARLGDITDFADIGDHLLQPVKTYSSGMYVRLAFAVIAHVDADILVIDEALAVGDVFFTQKCMNFLKSFQENGTIIFVTHDTSSVLALCNKAVWLDNGKLAGWGSAKSICESYLSDYYALNRQSDFKQQKELKHSAYKKLPLSDFRDCRQDLMAVSTLRNDLEFSGFAENSGTSNIAGDVIVEDVYFLDQESRPVRWFVGGELVTLKIVFRTQIDLFQPIVGFLIKDKLGQALFGENTFIRYADRKTFFPKGIMAQAEFVFRMPVMPAGEYTVGVAVASGTQDDHVMHTWVHDALVIKSHSKSVTTGLLGIPMLEIAMERHVE